MTSAEEPYPFVTPIPPLDPTAIDGVYERHVSRVLAGGGPVACRRCAPYRIEVGTTELTFDKGRYSIAHEGPGPTSSQFKSQGHFTLDGGQIELFNDPSCTQMRGSYRWMLADGKLVLRAIEDECPFSGLRERFMELTAWDIRG
jgi:hypothetical protein